MKNAADRKTGIWDRAGKGAPSLPALRLRPETAGDEAFLETLYIANRWRELLSTGWSDLEKTLFLKRQFELQSRHYAAHYRNALRHMVKLREKTVGRLCLMPDDGDIRVVDIGLMPAHHGGGIGTALIRWVQTLAIRQSKTVSLHVVRGNPAQRLYVRLGFVSQGDASGTHQFMLWTP